MIDVIQNIINESIDEINDFLPLDNQLTTDEGQLLQGSSGILDSMAIIKQFSLGFKVDKKISMMKRVEDNGVFWDEIPEGQIKSIPAERYFLHMMKYKEMV